MAWNIGANDTANSLGTSIGSGVLSLRGALIRIAIFDFLGAVFFGTYVTKTIGKGIVDTSSITDVTIITIGAFSALSAAGIWITIATWKGLPVSTTHSIVGAMLGFGLISLGTGSVNWAVMKKIVLSWITSPIFGAIGAFVIYTLIRKFVLERTTNLSKVERVFGYLQIATAMYVGFSFGSNDVANAVGPIYLVLTYHGGTIMPIWVLAFGAIGIIIGAFTWGYKVIMTVGTRITKITPTLGFSAEYSTATVILIASALGLPISTSHTVVGSVIGVGLAKGRKEALYWKVVWKIVQSWLLTVPITMGVCAGIYLLIKYFV